ncbi:MFS transporter [Streptomyces sp. 1268]|uniref:MFS transporter n=1 Tax=Streptomyces sp. 1268 TaxID=3231942 RepID=UPI0038D38735
MPAWLFALLAAAFVFYTDDYVIAGVLPEIARDLGVSEAQAGQLVTVFSLTVALAAPIAGVTLARVSRRHLFTASFAVFVAANLMAATAEGFGFLMALRVMAALAAAASTPAVFAYAAERAPEGHIGRYVAVVALGVTGSIAAGVPIGTWIGGHFGWRATFLAMAVAGIAALLFLLATLESARTEGPADLQVVDRALAHQAYHSPFREPGRRRLESLLKRSTLDRPAIPVVTSIPGRYTVSSGAEAADALVVSETRPAGVP